MSKLLNQEPIFIDPEAIMNKEIAKKKDEQMKNKIIERQRRDKKDYAKWIEDKSRVNQINKLYDVDNSRNAVPIEVFLTYDAHPDAKVTSDTQTGLKPIEERSLRLFPIAKDLKTGIIYRIPDHLCSLQINEEAMKWDEIRATQPSLEERMQRPPTFLWGCDLVWASQRFSIDPFSITTSPQKYYTFLVPETALLLPIK